MKPLIKSLNNPTTYKFHMNATWWLENTKDVVLRRKARGVAEKFDCNFL